MTLNYFCDYIFVLCCNLKIEYGRKNMPKEKIIILGHSGFVGSYLYYKLQSESMFEVLGFSINEIDLLDIGAYWKLADVCDEKTTIIMAAALLRSRSDNVSILESNIKMVLNLANFLSSNKIKHLIYTSSVSIYGKTSKSPITEISPANPDSFYSSAKACGELILKRICEESGIILTTLRPGRIYGKNDITSPIFNFSQNIILGKPIEIYGDGSHRFYCVHQNDLLKVMTRVISEEIRGDYNVIPSSGVTLLELAELLFELSGRKVEVKFKPAVYQPILLAFNNYKLQAVFGKFPFISLEEGVKKYFAPIIP